MQLDDTDFANGEVNQFQYPLTDRGGCNKLNDGLCNIPPSHFSIH